MRSLSLLYPNLDLNPLRHPPKRELRPIVRTGWIVESDSDTARLVTLYVRRKK